MSGTNRNAEEQPNYVYADAETKTQFVPEEDEEQRFQQELEKEVTDENYYNEMVDSTYDDDLTEDGLERADDDEIIMYGEGREEAGPELAFPFPFLEPTIIEVVFDEDQQQFVAVT